jgi:hypothetical protein
MKLILIELNEINFDVVASYVVRGEALPGFQKLLASGLLETSAEADYSQLEPWIQWPSVHTGMTYAEHRIFRLGDMVNSIAPQFFEQIEEAGYRVGAISPMNARNALTNPDYFVPDPWTNTPSDGSFFSRCISSAVSQAVNDNAQSRLTVKTVLSLVVAFFGLVKPRKIPRMILYVSTVRGKPWRKALFLDMFLHEIHMTLYRKYAPNFSTVFLNAGAHIQHHYFFNSPFSDRTDLKNPSWYVDEKEDPVLEMLKCYDDMLQELTGLPDAELLVVTGLSQKPYDRAKFYYRLRNHEQFLSDLGIKFVEVLPRMTRDFLISFDTAESALTAHQQLGKVRVNGDKQLFAEIDNRGAELFVTLTYPDEITDTTTINVGDNLIPLKPLVAFVAIKNGMHQGKGFAYFSDGIREFMPQPQSHVSKIHASVLGIFGIEA